MSRDKVVIVVLALAVLLLLFTIVRSCTRDVVPHDDAAGSEPAVLRTAGDAPPHALTKSL